MEMMAALFRDTKSFILGFTKDDIKIFLRALFMFLCCVFLYQCSSIIMDKSGNYDCRYVSQINDWICIDRTTGLTAK